MRRGEPRLDLLIFDQAKRLIVALPLFILHDAALLIDHTGRDRPEQIAHAVAFQEQRAIECCDRHRLEIIGAIEIGRAVEIGRADRLGIGEIVLRRILGAVEHQMLEQMGKAGLTLGLELRADIVPHTDRDDRGFAIGIDDDAQAIGQAEFAVGNIDLLDQFRDRHGLGRSLRDGGHGERGERHAGEREQLDGHRWIPWEMVCEYRTVSAGYRTVLAVAIAALRGWRWGVLAGAR
ncbi:hypothetical protein D9M73_157500 [compost metagenome]